MQADGGCPVTRGGVDLRWYADRDGAWRDLGLAAPARRALVDAGLLRPAELRGRSAAEIASLHGMGPSAMARLAPFLDTP